MDEILIGEKKYISSKQAAKATGYAKDYIGQLCREGRVPARLVGRSWYVLETAIQDHRFGEEKTEQEAKAAAPATSMSHETWESPRYEAAPVDALPSINQIRDAEGEDPSEGVAQHLQDTWRAWFERVAEEAPSVPDVVSQKPDREAEAQEAEAEAEEREGTSVPIRAIHHQLPAELLPRRHYELRARPARDEVIEEKSEVQIIRASRLMWPLQAAGAVVAVAFAALAVIGTGYFDKYIISHSQVGMVAGVVLYDK